MHPRTSRGRAWAFSLIELLVVVAVIAVLISLLLPSLSQAREAGRGAACLGNLRSIGQAVVMYCDANKEHFPISSHTAGSLVASDNWLVALEDYGAIPAARLCPTDPYRSQKLTSYATNEHFEPLTPGIDYNPITHKPIPGGRAMAFDRVGLLPRTSVVIYAYEPGGAGTTDHLVTHAFASAKDVKAALAVTRHLGSSNFLFADGHARAWAWSDLSSAFSPATSPFDPLTAR